MLRANLIDLSGPYNGLANKVKFARRMWLEAARYHPEVRIFAENAAGKGTRIDQARTLFNTLRRVITYYGDHVGLETTKAPWVMIKEIRQRSFTGGDCDDQATLAYVLLRSIGIPAALRVAWYGVDTMPRHVYALAWLGGKWTSFDTTRQEMSIEAPYAKVQDFQ